MIKLLMQISQKRDVIGINGNHVWNQRIKVSVNKVSNPRQQKLCSLV